MLFSPSAMEKFKSLQSKVLQGMAQFGVKTPYFIEGDPTLSNYERIRDVWWKSLSVKKACDLHRISRSAYYELEADLPFY